MRLEESGEGAHKSSPPARPPPSPPGLRRNLSRRPDPPRTTNPAAQPVLHHIQRFNVNHFPFHVEGRAARRPLQDEKYCLHICDQESINYIVANFINIHSSSRNQPTYYTNYMLTYLFTYIFIYSLLCTTTAQPNQPRSGMHYS